MTNRQRSWSAHTGFLLATAGAAIGLGNLWKFPYLAGKYGGFAFVLPYLLLVVWIGVPVLMLEFSLGRYMRQNPLLGLGRLHRGAAVLGAIGVTSCFLIRSYYSVVGGWTLKTVASYAVTGAAPQDFPAYAATFEPVVWGLGFIAVTFFVYLKAKAPFGRLMRRVMPGLFVTLCALAVVALCQPGAPAALGFLYTPQIAFSAEATAAALGQVFYSLGLGMGITMMYGSQLPKEENIEKNSWQIAALDTILALIMCTAAFEAAFATGQPVSEGPMMIFNVLPRLFARLPLGPVWAIGFFLLMTMTAVQSAVSLLHCVCSYVCQRFGCSLGRAALWVGVAIAALGTLSALSFGAWEGARLLGRPFFAGVALLTDRVLLPLGGAGLCVYVGWGWGPAQLVLEMQAQGVKLRLEKWWVWSIRVIAPLLIVLILVMGLY